MNSKLKMTLGIIILMIGLWGGAYLSSLVPYEHWCKFPCLITNMAVCATGLVMTCLGAGEVWKW
jgi:hypothetical protein